MARIHLPLVDVIGHGRDQMTDVVQQRGSDDGLALTHELREVRGLQRVLGHRDRLAEIRTRASPGKKGECLVDCAHPTLSGCAAPIGAPMAAAFADAAGTGFDRAVSAASAARLKTLSRVR